MSRRSSSASSLGGCVCPVGRRGRYVHTVLGSRRLTISRRQCRPTSRLRKRNRCHRLDVLLVEADLDWGPHRGIHRRPWPGNSECFEAWTLFCGDHRSYLFGRRFHSWSDSREYVGGDETLLLTDRPLGLTGVVGTWLQANSET